MRTIGIDPGYATVGYGCLDYNGVIFETVDFGAVTTQPNIPFCQRLKTISDDIGFLSDRYKPDAFSIEKLFFNTNRKTVIDVAQSRGVILLCAAVRGIPVYEYTPLQVKQAVTGYGKAEKTQVMEMTRKILQLSSIPKPDDAADALAAAICHAHTQMRGNRTVRA